MQLELESVVSMDPEVIGHMSPQEVANQIDQCLNKMEEFIDQQSAMHKQGKMSAKQKEDGWQKAMEEWGKWSHILNRVVRQKVEDNKACTTIEEKRNFYKFNYVYQLWWNTYYIIELLYRTTSGLSLNCPMQGNIIFTDNIFDKNARAMLSEKRAYIKQVIEQSLPEDKIDRIVNEILKAIAEDNKQNEGEPIQ